MRYGRNHTMKVSDNMSWTKPFIAIAAMRVPVWKLKAVTGYVIKPGLKIQAQARMYCHSKSDYRLRFCLNKTEIVSLECALTTLAHELAHLVEWEHTPRHLKLTAQLLCDFADLSQVMGVVDTSRRPKI